MEATQRGRPFSLQVCLMRSIIRSAVVFGLSVTLLSWGGGGPFTFVHSSMTVSADEGTAKLSAGASTASGNRWRIWTMIFSPVIPKGTNNRFGPQAYAA